MRAPRPTATTKSADEIGADGIFCLGRLNPCGFACGNALQDPGHVVAQVAHDLHALFVLADILRRAAVHHWPILAGRNGHAADGEILGKLVECGGRARAARAANRRADLRAKLAAAGVEHAIQKRGDAAARGRSPEKTLAMWDRVLDGETRYIKGFKSTADFLLDTSFTYELGLISKLLGVVRRQFTLEGHNAELWDETARRFEHVAPLELELLPEDSMLREFYGGAADRRAQNADV